MDRNDRHDKTKKIKAIFKCSDEDKSKFKSSRCLLTISVGQESHEGERFEATIGLVNSLFSSAKIALYDSVQRYTMALDSDKDPEKFHEIANKEGDLWLKRNEKYYGKLKNLEKILRWDDWYTHQDFQKSYDRIETLYNNDEAYKQAIHANIDDYIKRYTTHLSETVFDAQHAFDCCLQYLKEECAVMCLWTLWQFDFEVYPAGRNQAMTATYEKLIKPVYPNLLKSVALRFKKYEKKGGS